MEEVMLKASPSKDLGAGRRRKDLRNIGAGGIATFLFFILLFSFIFGSSVGFHSAKSLIFYDRFSAALHFFSPRHSTLHAPVAHNFSVQPNESNAASGNGQTDSSPRYFSGENLWHYINDEELLRRASMVPPVSRPVDGKSVKVAFLFLTRGAMPLRPLWERFFTGHHGLFSIYLHTSPDFKEEPPHDSVFFGRRIPSKTVRWGQVSMIDAERRLLANALLDPANEHFVLLSESCIPLFAFPTIYDYLTRSALSFISSFDDPKRTGRGRYSPRMKPTVSLADWRKGSQWFELRRMIAVDVVSDRTYYPVLRAHCWTRCYMDEHYLPTLVRKLRPGLNSNRSLTWADWSRGGAHPATYNARDVSDGRLERMRRGSGECVYNGNVTSVCFLFARKFDASALVPLMLIAPNLLGI